MFHLLGRKIAYIKNLLGKEKLYIPDILSLKKKKKMIRMSLTFVLNLRFHQFLKIEIKLKYSFILIYIRKG